MPIKIISGWSNPGGSTISWINLTNEMNKRGYETIFYGSHNYHLDKCKADLINFSNVSNNDIIIVHFINNLNYICQKKIFSSHEQDLFPIKNINYKSYNKIHYVSQHQKEYHIIKYPYFIIPNILDDLKPSKNPKNIFGIISSIDKNKNIHTSIQRALNDGAKEILIYGIISDQQYYIEHIKPLINKYNIKLMGHCDDKQKMYNSVSRVYQDSKNESWGYIRAECLLTETEFFGNDTTKNIDIWDTDKIIDHWLNEIYN